MTRPPEYNQVARWMRAISGDPGLLDDIRAGYPGSGQVLGEEFVEQQRQLLVDEARSTLTWIDLEGKSLDEVAEAYHQDQVAKYARRQHALQERIRELSDGDFEVPSWCAYQAARDGTDLELVIQDHRQNELSDARLDLGLLPGRYQVTEERGRNLLGGPAPLRCPASNRRAPRRTRPRGQGCAHPETVAGHTRGGARAPACAMGPGRHAGAS